MSFSAVSRVFLKLPRLFLKLCWWVLVGMAVNCKVPGFHGGLGFNSKQHKIQQQLQSSKGGRKRRRMLLVAWVLVGALGSLWIFSNMNDNGVSQSKEKYHFKICREKARILQEHLNVSMNHSNPLAIVLSNFCNGKSPSAIDQKKYVEYVESMPLDRHSVMLEKQHRWTAEVMETPDQCPVQDGSILEKLGLLRFEDEYAIFSLSRDIVSSIMSFDIMSKKDENISQARASGNSKQQHQKKLPSLFLNVCWWVLVGMMANCKICGFHIKLGLILKKQQQQQQQQQKQQQWQQVQQQQQQHLQSSKGGGKWRRKLLVLWVLNGVIGSLWILWSMNNNIVSRRKETLANMCDERARMLQDQFNVSMNHVHALAILVSTFHHGKNPSAIDQKTFAEYTERTAFERPLTSGVAYALKVLHSEREKFEKQLGWTIKKMDTEDQSPVHDEYIPEKLDPSPVQDEYAPVILSQDTVSHIVSIDMMSGKEDRENILRARASGKGVLTSPFKLLKSNHLGVVLTFAVYKIDLPPNATPEERIEATEGYLGASFDVPSLVEKLLQQLASKQTIVVNVYDTTNSSAPINMYGPNVTDTGLKHLSNLDFGDPVRKHEMYCRFKQKSPLPWSAITASVGFLVIALLVGHIFHAAVNRIAKVEDDFREMKELKARAEAADVAKSQFLATVSHEIRTPMNGVLGMLQMLMDTDLDATQEDFARTAQASGKALIALINEVLDQAKIESGRLELEAVPFDVRSSLDNVLSLFSGKSQTKGIELAVYISDRVPEIVTGDPGRFRQIITNLVGNSIKFTEEGHIFVSVHLAEEVCGLQESSSEIPNQHSNLIVGRTKTLHDTLSGFSVVDRWKSWEGFKKLSNVTGTTDTISLLVTVEDTGVGIPQEAQGRIFMPFMQADSSTSRTYGGTGIGLSISKCLVDLMSGEMGFVSKPGVGSTFAFSAVFTRGQSDSQDMKRHQSESMPSEFRGMRGLVVDGRSVRADVTKYHLERLGMIVQISLDTRYELSCILEACNSSAMEHVDVVLVDKEGWGKGSGLGFPSLLKDLVQNGRLKPPQNLPKMFLLATSISSTELEEAKSAGYEVPVIMKPLRASMIAARLQQALGVGNKQQLDRQQPSTLQCLLNGKQILVVDDNVVNQRVAAGALKKYGANVTCAGSGKTALVYLQPPHKFDACFMDVQMPEMDGFEATKQIRLLENKVNEEIRSGEASKEMYGNIVHWHIPILAMTADVIQATHEQCVSCGMDDYVSKPFEEEKLYSAIAHFFQPRSNV